MIEFFSFFFDTLGVLLLSEPFVYMTGIILLFLVIRFIKIFI